MRYCNKIISGKFFILLFIVISIIYSADNLKKIYNSYKIAEQTINYKKYNDAQKILSNNEFDALPSFVKSQYSNYGQFVSSESIRINTVKKALRDQLDSTKIFVDSQSCYSAGDKNQYKSEIDSAKNNIKDLK